LASHFKRELENRGSVQKRTLSRIWLGVFIFVALVVVVRATAPGLILRKLNATLATKSPVYSAHIEDIDLALWRMAYGFENIEVKLKKQDKVFLRVKNVDISLAWRELLNLLVVVDIDVEQADLIVDPDLIASAKGGPKPTAEDASKARAAVVPFRIERVRLFNSSVAVKDIPDLPLDQAFRITGVNAGLTNLVPSNKNPDTEFLAQAMVMDKAPLNAEGDAQLMAKPIRWEVDAELKGFELVTMNAMLARLVPLSFDKGVMDVYAVVKAEGDQIKGSVKPFIDDVEFVGDKRDFQGVKHGAFDVLSAIAAFALENREENSVATQIDFTWSQGKFDVDVAKAIKQSLRHRFREPLSKKLN